MRLTSSPTEWTTAVTDGALAVLCLILLTSLLRLDTNRPWTTRVWAAVFVCLATASGLGAVTHGLDLSDVVTTALWQPLYIALGLSVALFLVGAVGDWRGEGAGRKALPWAVGAGIGFFAVTRLVDDFRLFLIYEGVAMAATLGIYIRLWQRQRVGAGLVVTGITLTIVAAIVQASGARARVIWPFDHNGLFHLVQMVAIPFIARGIRTGMTHSSLSGVK